MEDHSCRDVIYCLFPQNFIFDINRAKADRVDIQHTIGPTICAK